MKSELELLEKIERSLATELERARMAEENAREEYQRKSIKAAEIDRKLESVRQTMRVLSVENSYPNGITAVLMEVMEDGQALTVKEAHAIVVRKGLDPSGVRSALGGTQFQRVAGEEGKRYKYKLRPAAETVLNTGE